MTTSTPDPDDVVASTSHYQIVTPGFATTPLVPQPTGSDGTVSTQSMTTFLRLGAATDPDPATTYGPQLLNMAVYTSPSAVGNSVFDAATTAAAGVTDVSDACQALATAVVTAVGTYGGGTTATWTSSVASIANAASLAPPANTTALAAAQSAAVYAALGPFVDDTRDQGTDNNANGLAHSARVAESGLLLSKGGWRDHTDGNRITTTYGDKVEVIRGNFKLIVLGRQDQLGNGHVWESSGGMLQDNDLAPGQLTEIKWVESQNGTWRAIETCTKGDVETQFDGHVVERFVGGSVSTIVGREQTATATQAITADALTQLTAEYDEDLNNKFIDSTLTLDAYLTQRGYNQGTGATNQDYYKTEGGGSNPVVLEQTWASRIESYTGSAAAWVPDIIETTYATNITETTNVTTFAGTTNVDTFGETTNATGTVSSAMYANGVGEVVDVTGANNSLGSVSSGHVVSKLFATELWDEKHVSSTQEISIGAKWETVIGAWGMFKLGTSLEVFVGPTVSVATALKVELTAFLVDQANVKYENEGVKLLDHVFFTENGGLKFAGRLLSILV